MRLMPVLNRRFSWLFIFLPLVLIFGLSQFLLWHSVISLGRDISLLQPRLQILEEQQRYLLTHHDRVVEHKPPGGLSAGDRVSYQSQDGLQEQGFRAPEDVELEPIRDVPGGRREQEGGDDFLTLHVIAHTHNDPGWLHTFEDYHRDKSSKTLDSVINALQQHPHRRFSWVEVCFLERWWRDASEDRRAAFRKLVRNGQIELVMGGWVSPDEATPTFSALVSQLEEGHRWLRENVDPHVRPRVAWQIDPFGLSAGVARIFSWAGLDFDAAWRISEPDMRERLKKRELETVFEGLLLHLLPWSYTPPQAYLFEDPGVRIPRTNQEAEQLATQLSQEVRSRSQHFLQTKHLMWLWGHDFRFQHADQMFTAFEALQAAVKRRPELKLHIRFSTPSDYIAALEADKSLAFPAEPPLHDFMPYQAGPVNFWSGYFTSRPHLKRCIRHLELMIRAADIALAFLRSRAAIDSSHIAVVKRLFGTIEQARQIQGVLQHHDAITGTCVISVVQDYLRHIDESLSHLRQMLEEILPKLTGSASSLLQPAPPYPRPSISPALPVGPIRLQVFNPLAWQTVRVLELEVHSGWVTSGVPRVVDRSGQDLSVDVLPIVDQQPAISPERARLFIWVTLPPLGIVHLNLLPDDSTDHPPVGISSSLSILGTSPQWINVLSPPREGPSLELESSGQRVEFDPQGRLRRFVSENLSLPLEHSFLAYDSDPSWGNHYTFKAFSDTPKHKLDVRGWIWMSGRRGLVQEMVQLFGNSQIRTWRLEAEQRGVLIRDLLKEPSFRGPHDQVSRYTLSNHNRPLQFYSDANGLFSIPRKHRADVMISGNYFPTVRYSRLEGSDFTLSVLTDTSQGVANPCPGCLEAMNHRVAVQTAGNGERMDEYQPVLLTSRLLVGPTSAAFASRMRKLALELDHPPVIFHAVLPSKDDVPPAPFEPLRSSLPTDLHLMSLHVYNSSAGQIALRLAHLAESASIRLKVSPSQLFNEQTVPDLARGALESRSLSLHLSDFECTRRRWRTNRENRTAVMPDRVPCIPKTAEDDWPPVYIRSYFVNLQ